MRGGVRQYAAQATPQIDTEIGKKEQLWTETKYPQASCCPKSRSPDTAERGTHNYNDPVREDLLHFLDVLEVA